MKSELEYKGVKWRIYQGALIPDAPPHAEINLTDEDAEHLLKQTGAYFIRWTTDFDCSEETAFWYVIKDGSGSMDGLSTKIRTKVRRGLKDCTVEKVSAEYISQNGYEVYLSAFKRYRTFLKPVSRDIFRNSILNLKGNPDYEFFAVFSKLDNTLIAYNQNFIQGNSLNYSITKFSPEHLKLLPSYALFFTMNSYYLNERKMKYVNDGARSLSHDTKIQNYLIDNFKFRKAFCRLNIKYSRKVGMLVKVLYSFKNIINKININAARKIDVLLTHEQIRRSFENKFLFYIYNNKSELKQVNNLSSDYQLFEFSPSIFKLKFHEVSNIFIYIFWYLFSRGKYRIIYILNSEGKIIHYSHVLPSLFKYSFMSKKSLQIGPCWTDNNYRGQGIYPYVISYILKNNPDCTEFYMMTHDKNISSRKGLTKAGFRLLGRGVKSGLFGIYRVLEYSGNNMR